MINIPDTIAMYWHYKKRSPGGWLSGNAICCHHHGQSSDTRSRGGLKLSPTSVVYHCFNCKFSTSWTEGKLLSKKMKNFMEWLNVPSDVIMKCDIAARQLQGHNVKDVSKVFIPDFSLKRLPSNAHRISHWIEQNNKNIIPIIEYIYSRGLYLDDYDWYWSDDWKFKDKIIIPFTYKGKIVGYTARTILNTDKNRYWSDQQQGYIFNVDAQGFDRKFAILCEGPLDAISIGGISSLGSTISPSQNVVISNLQREIILVPDRDIAGLKLIEYALEYGWSVSFPNWDSDVKDINDAVRRYGRLITLYSIIQAKETNNLKINIFAKKWIRKYDI